MRLPSRLCLIAAVLLLAACGHSRVVQREEGARPLPPRSAPASRPAAAPVPAGAGYTVQRGDTLYGIAFRHGLDFRDVAAWNRIAAPYTIYPGQRLVLRSASAPVASAPMPSSAPVSVPAQTGFVNVPSAAPVATAPSTPSTPPSTPPSSAPVSGTPSPPTTLPPSTPVAGPVATTPSPVPATTPAVPTPVAPTTPMVVPPSAISASGWRWPTQGQLIGRFAAGDPKRQGIDIAGTAGQAVVAASDGTVVYSGAGLVGYGELIIIKHNDEWLSAYAHNRRRLVTEGTAVKRGQPIAELGRSGTSRDMLHFEVRRNGKPVDPMTVLPPP